MSEVSVVICVVENVRGAEKIVRVVGQRVDDWDGTESRRSQKNECGGAARHVGRSECRKVRQSTSRSPHGEQEEIYPLTLIARPLSG